MTAAKAEYTQALRDILRLDISTCTIELCIAARKDNAGLPEFRRLRLSQPLKEQFRDLASASLVEYAKQLQLRNLQLLEFEVAGRLENYQAEHVDLSKQPYDNILAQISPLQMLNGLDTFKEEFSFTGNMRFYVIVLQPPQGQPIYLYRRYSVKKMLRQAPPLAIQRILGNSDEFESVQTPVFLFDEDIDCISRGSNLFIFGKSDFYYMFRVLDDLIQSARETLDRIRDRIPISNFNVFERSCMNNKSKMSKLTSIARRPYLDQLTIAMMKPVIKEHQLHIPVVTIDGDFMLQFDTDYPWDILKLLDDDYLTSIMTGQNYAVDAKRDP